MKLMDRLKQVNVQKVLQSPTPTWTVVHGHVLDMLKLMPDNCVQAVVTSPPYWGLREYGTEPQVWNGEINCEHEWVDNSIGRRSGGLNEWSKSRFMRKIGQTSIEIPPGSSCIKCKAWCGSLGLEPTSEQYVQHLVQIFREVKRILRNDGVCWLNIDDTYSGGTIGRNDAERKYKKLLVNIGGGYSRKADNIPTGNLCLVPQRLLLALQQDGWYIRDIIAWVKMWQDAEGKSSGTVMPGGTGTGRMTSAWEYIFQLTKSPQYYFDLHAEKTTSRSNYRNVFRVNIQPHAGPHIAPFPEGLISPLIEMSTSGKGCCPQCRTPYARESGLVYSSGWMPKCLCFGEVVTEKRFVRKKGTLKKQTVQRFSGKMPEPFPCIVLDPFTGSGTTGQVALRLRRSFIGIDLNPSSLKEAEERIGNRWVGKRGRMGE